MPTTFQQQFVHELQTGSLPGPVEAALVQAFRTEHSLVDAVVVSALSVKGRRDQGSGFRRWQALFEITFPTITVEFDQATSNADLESGPHNIGVKVTTEDGNPTTVGVSVDVRDLLTGTAVGEPTPAWVYTFLPNPMKVLIPAGTAHNAVLNVVVEVNSIQTVTAQFAAAPASTPGDIAQAVNIPVSIITSDGLQLAEDVDIDVRDLLTGTAANPADYTMTTPQTLTFVAGTPSGSVLNAVLTTTGVNNPDGTVNLDLDNVVGASEGAPNTHTITIAQGAIPHPAAGTGGTWYDVGTATIWKDSAGTMPADLTEAEDVTRFDVNEAHAAANNFYAATSIKYSPAIEATPNGKPAIYTTTDALGALGVFRNAALSNLDVSTEVPQRSFGRIIVMKRKSATDNVSVLRFGTNRPLNSRTESSDKVNCYGSVSGFTSVNSLAWTNGDWAVIAYRWNEGTTELEVSINGGAWQSTAGGDAGWTVGSGNITLGLAAMAIAFDWYFSGDPDTLAGYANVDAFIAALKTYYGI